MRTLRTSVRRLIEFILRSGDLDAQRDRRGNVDAMLAGSEIHRTLQARGGDSYQAEVSLACSFYYPDGAFNPHAARLDIPEQAVSDQQGFFLRVEGRADGVIDDGTHPLLIDEIKGVTRDVSTIEGPDLLHEAQALTYAYLYLRAKRGSAAISAALADQVTVRVTYASMDTGELRQFERRHRVLDIEAWFLSLLGQAQRWAAWRHDHDERRRQTLSALTFPLTPRVGQQEVTDAVDATIRAGSRLFVQAPTGSGKTLATLYPALKALGEGTVSRVAFLTAKTMTRGPVLECLDLLRRQDFGANVLVMTARDKICPLRRDTRDGQVRLRPLTSLCNPLECPYARGHFDAVNDALFEAIAGTDVIDARLIGEVAARHHVCPYELQRDATRWADIVICDYHYAFAPSASLVGLADEPGDATAYLVDEAHNLVERMRDRYSAALAVSTLEALGRLLRARGGLDGLEGAVRAVVSDFPAWENPSGALPDARGRARRAPHQVVKVSEAFASSIATLAEGIDGALEQLLAAENGARTPDGATVELYLTLRDTLYQLRALLGALQRAEIGYVTFLDRTERGSLRLNVSCVDPSHDLAARLELAKAAVFFSGTLLPLDYHRKLLAARDDDRSVYAKSSFDPRNRQVLIGSDVSARFSRRGPALYARIAAYLAALLHARQGNYLVFLPSYAMVDEVWKALSPHRGPHCEVARQRPGMREDERERFVARFRAGHAPGTSLIGLCVLGGIFGESIDLPGEALVGVVVVGTGMPVTSAQREVIREYFDAREGTGFAYAYTYPGMAKVLQAAGRLIRTERDRGLVLLLDDRFLEPELQRAFPREWTDVRTCTLETLPTLVPRA